MKHCLKLGYTPQGEDKDERVHKRTHKIVKVEWNLLTYKRKVGKLRLFNLERWRDRVNIIELFKILKCIIKNDKIFFLYAVPYYKKERSLKTNRTLVWKEQKKILNLHIV